jgi:hypothetical protein
MWKQWCIEGGKEKGKESAHDNDKINLEKFDDKFKEKGKGIQKRKDGKSKKKET